MAWAATCSGDGAPVTVPSRAHRNLPVRPRPATLHDRPERDYAVAVRGAALAAATALLILNATGAPAAPTGREVIAEAQARNGFATWRDRRSLITLEGVDGANHSLREAEVYEQTDPHG